MGINPASYNYDQLYVAVWVVWVITMFSEAKKYHDYARECLRLAEEATQSDVRERLIELSRVWMEAALREEKRFLDGASKRTA
jgi:hypothetical protein